MRRRVKSWFVVTLLAGLGAAVVAWIRRGGQPATAPLRASEKARVFHRPGCRYYGSAAAATEFRSRDDAVAAGFSPCKVCRP